MSSLQDAYWLDDVLVFLVAAGIVVPFLHRARLGSVEPPTLVPKKWPSRWAARSEP